MVNLWSNYPFFGPSTKMSKMKILLFESLENRHLGPLGSLNDESLVKLPLFGSSTKMSKMKILLFESLENRYLDPLGSVGDEPLLKFPLIRSSTKNE